MLHSKQVMLESRQGAEEVNKEAGLCTRCQHAGVAEQKSNMSLLGALNKALSTLQQQTLQVAQ